MLIRTNFDTFANAYLIYISSLLQTFHLQKVVVLIFLQRQKSLELVFRSRFWEWEGVVILQPPPPLLQAMPVLNFEVFLKYPHFLRSKVVWKLMR